MKRFFLALIFSPLISSLLFSIFEPIVAGRAPNFKLSLTILPIFYIFTFLGFIVLGLPVYFILQKFDVLNLWSLTIAGGFSGVTYMVIFQLIIFPRVSSTETITYIPGFMMGTISALIFGLLIGLTLNLRNNEKK